MDNEKTYYQKNDSIVEHERLFRILNKLNDIRSEAYMRGESEQFILGILTSTEVIRAEISGPKFKK
jgi:hypothetical protein